VSNEVRVSKNLVKQRTNSMNVFITDLNEDGSGFSKKISGDV